jgi:hypothetical protein
MSPIEAAAWLAGERHSDHPECVCPVIAAYVRPISDWASYYQRQALREFLPRLIGSRSVEHLVPRAEFLVRQAVTVFLPLMYDELKQTKIAANLRALSGGATLKQLRESILIARRLFFAVDNVVPAVAAAWPYAAAAAERASCAIGAIRLAGTDFATAASAYAAAYAAANAAAIVADVVGQIATAISAYAYADKEIIMAPCEDARQQLWEAALTALDGALAIGPAGPVMLTPDMIERLKTYQRLVEATTAK